MQNDFIDGPLGTPEAVSIVDKVCEKIRSEEWDYIYTTQDTHDERYLNTQEGQKLPVLHCQEGTEGWYLNGKINDEVVDRANWREVFKYCFGGMELIADIKYLFNRELTDHTEKDIELTLVGVCTDICVISNALLLKAHFPEMKIVVDADCCAGSTIYNHIEALDVMKSCQIDVFNDPIEKKIFNTKECRRTLAVANILKIHCEERCEMECPFGRK